MHSHPQTSGTSENNDHVPSILSSQEKVDFLRKCCASPILRFILHLLSDRRQESLCSWYGGPFGVKIWNTRKFTESYNAAMGTKMNFTNISRALQACEHITMAAVRLWKRLKQGEYSFFPTTPVMEQSTPAHYYDRVSYRTPPCSGSRNTVEKRKQTVHEDCRKLNNFDELAEWQKWNTESFAEIN
ncbi:hypothetical protein OSTOST_07561, partial [Ostertagia ostertagi]